VCVRQQGPGEALPLSSHRSLYLGRATAYFMTWTPTHPDEDTHTPEIGHPHTRTWTPTHPDLDTHTPGLGHPPTWIRTPAHPDSLETIKLLESLQKSVHRMQRSGTHVSSHE
jgi:hypothetical protein